MKRKLRGLAALLAAVMVMGVLSGGCYAKSTSVKHIGYRTTPTMKVIKIKWKKQKKISFYRLYRLDVTGWNEGKNGSPTMDQYKRIAKLSGKRKSYKDRKVKPGHSYAYQSEGYRKSNGKAKLVCTTYLKDYYQEDNIGLSRPWLLNTGDGEFYTNSPRCLYLYYDVYTGVQPKDAVVYRKEDAGAYRKISVKWEKKRHGPGSTFWDNTVRPGHTYTYKLKSTVKKGKKRYYSAFTNEVIIPAVNFAGEFNVKCLTPAGKTDTFLIQLTSKANNGVMTLAEYKDEEGTLDNGYSVTSGKESQSYPMRLVGYSWDNKVWQGMPAKGVLLKAGQSIYLKCKMEGESPYFGGSTATVSEISLMDPSVKYDGPGAGDSILYIDLCKGTGRVHMNFD